MKISSINNTNNNTNFSGRILLAGKGWKPNMKDLFRFNPEVVDLASGSHDVIGKLYSKKASRWDINHYMGEPVYRLELLLGNSKSKFVNKIKAYLNLLPKVSIIHDYHCEESFLEKMENRLNAEKLKKVFGISK